MWRVVAEERITCTECFHDIPAGAECLSQMPVDMPEEFRRRKYRNFCIECDKCSRKEAQASCYVRHLSHWYTGKKETKEPARCGYCSASLPENTWVVVQKIYAWPESGDDGLKSGSSATRGEGTVSGVSVGAASFKSSAGGWHNLSRETQRLFQTRGLGRGLGSRTPTMAKRFYEKQVPTWNRNQGENAVKEYLRGKHASHIKSVVNAPSRARAPGNLVLEDATKNIARGSRNMTSAEVAAAKSAGRASATRIAATTTLKSAAKGGGIAAAIEAPIAGLENFFHWKRGRKRGRDAAGDVAKSTATAAGFAAFATVGAKVAVGLGLSLGPLGTPLAITGGAVFAGSTVYRIAKAAKRELPLDEYHVYFCKDRPCRVKFAWDITMAARAR